MRGSIHNPKDSHPECTCGRKFPSMGKLIAHWSMPCDKENT